VTFALRDWRDEALCAYIDPDLWFPSQGGLGAAARRICGQCPVRAECLEDALSHHDMYGIWGGLSYKERLRLGHAGLGQAAA
jgi:WhiB family redox-sensing transcriptional regulator